MIGLLDQADDSAVREAVVLFTNPGELRRHTDTRLSGLSDLNRGAEFYLGRSDRPR